MIKGNKGEWSEVYALFKLLGEEKIFAGDENLNKIADLFFPIIKILRTEESSFEYLCKDSKIIVKNKEKEFIILVQKFQENSIKLLEAIKKSSGSSFAVPEIENFLATFNSKKLKAKSSVKTDITIMIHDLRTNQTPLLGFSIKSQLGGPSTLLNAGSTTNFIYEIKNLDKETVQKVNALSSFKDKFKLLEKVKIAFSDTQNKIFRNNLILIDSSLDKILASVALKYYKTQDSRLDSLTKRITLENPMKFEINSNPEIYSYKIKRFLTDVALGMMPSKPWSGKYDTTGGYLVIKGDGEVLCYHIYNRNEFENYLLKNTKLETPSTTRHDFGKIHEKDGRFFIKLNLQIRFIK